MEEPQGQLEEEHPRERECMQKSKVVNVSGT